MYSILMAFYINSASIDGNELDNGDEIGVMDNGLCIGVIRPYDLEGTPYQLFVPADNPTTPEFDGYTAGNDISFWFWDISSQTVYSDVDISIIDGPDIYQDYANTTVELSLELVYGCNDMEACNYNPDSNTNDGSCEYHDPYYCSCELEVLDDCGVCGGDNSSCLGCTDIDALNYDDEAIIDDDSCVYDNLGDMNFDGFLNVLDIVLMANLVLEDGYAVYADVNDDGFVNILDLVIMVNWVLHGLPPMDIDGNVYETVQIGDQLWMAENLKVTHYRNGDGINYSDYDNEYSNSEIYGRLYSWNVVNDDRGVCPDGFHVPSDAEYTVLTDYLGGELVAGGKMKEAGTEHWNSPNTGATNESGFTGFPGGYRSDMGNYYNMGDYNYLWSADENESHNAWHRRLSKYDSEAKRDYLGNNFEFSIRCLKD